jgi:fumarate reductase flavoprotein subunit
MWSSKSWRKVTLCLLLCLVVVSVGVFAAGCAGPKEGAKYKAGTYTAKGKGNFGDVTVTVTFSETAITDIKIGENKETPDIAKPAFTNIPKAIIEGQTLAVDVVSGATNSSRAVLQAVEDCVRQAGGDVEALKAAKGAGASPKEQIEKTADVVVIGGGGAGLAAATSAAENGASVVLIEKTAALGGNTLRAGGAYNAVDPKRQQAVKMTKPLLDDLKALLNAKESDFGEFGPTLKELKRQINEYLQSGNTDKLFDSVELHMIQTYLGGKRTAPDGTEISGNVDLVRTLCTNSPKAMEWLEGYGLKWKDDISTVLGALWPRTHGNTQPIGTGYINTLSKAATDLGVEIMLETKGEELIVENGRVVGVKAKKTDGTPVVLKANKGVVMATGGFSANPEMRAKYNIYWPDLPKTMPTTNTSAATGDGIVMGEAVGANLVGMGFIQLMPSSHPVTGALSGGLWTSAESQVFVNKEGRRFVNEYAERDVLAAAALKQPDGLFYIICDQVTAGNPQPGGKNGWGDDIDTLIETKSVYKADTLEDLAKQLGMSPSVLVEEIKKYNSYVEQGHDPEFGKSNFGPKIEVPPFYATPRSPSVHHTMGGLEIDTLARVIDKNGKPIPGFYAAGEVTGGIHAGNRLGGNALADVMVFGRIAGESAAKAK